MKITTLKQELVSQMIIPIVFLSNFINTIESSVEDLHGLTSTLSPEQTQNYEVPQQQSSNILDPFHLLKL